MKHSDMECKQSSSRYCGNQNSDLRMHIKLKQNIDARIDVRENIIKKTPFSMYTRDFLAYKMRMSVNNCNNLFSGNES